MSDDLKLKILSQVGPEMAAIEEALTANLGAHLEIVRQVASHILFSGGKRLRPLLMVLCARLCGSESGREPFFSTVFEYLHAASLIHADLVDGAALRRGNPVAHSIWGNPIAVLVGDFLLARSLSIASETEDPRVIRVIAGITENMSQGEIHQLSQKRNLRLTEAEYLEIIRRKTAVLMEGACKVGALVAKADSRQATALAKYGYHLGMAFQMADDLLDYTADTHDLGKAVGADLREGKLTLPVIHALQSAPESDRRRMEAIILREAFEPEEFEILIGMLVRYKGIEYTARRAGEAVSLAKERLTTFADGPEREVLSDIADYALVRKH